MHKYYSTIQKVFYLLAISLLLSSCSSYSPLSDSDDSAPGNVDYARLERVKNAVPRVEAHSRSGNPSSYDQNGNTYYVLASSKGYVKRGKASWYGTKFHGQRTSSGERYDMFAMTAAHKTLPLPTYAKVTNLHNGRSVIVKINDRGPFVAGRIIDLSYAAAYKLGIIKEGTGYVEVRAIDPRNPQSIPSGQVVAAAPLERVTPAQVRPVSFTPVQTVSNTHSTTSLFLQVGAFSSRRNAEHLLQRLSQSSFHNVTITQAPGNIQNVYRVRIGPLPNENVADRIAERLLSIGLGRGHIVLD
jgi:rare lipoprotein A